LPAVPANLSAGQLSGIIGRGAFELDIEWADQALSALKVKSLKGNKLNLRYKGKVISVDTQAGKTLTLYICASMA